MDVKALAQAYEPFIIEKRRWYHMHPELSSQEKETLEQIKRDLAEIGVTEITQMDDCYGLIADIKGAKPGKTVALRADIDALPVTEITGAEYCSTVPGVMHACGHDTHIAMILGAAKILSENKDELCGNVRLIIQPAEEQGRGAKAMRKDPRVLDGVSAIYGQHIWGQLDAPLVDVTPGNRMAAGTVFYVDIIGNGTHGATPHLGIDAISIACAVVNNIQQHVSRMNDPLNPIVITVGTFNAGDRYNVVAPKAHFEGMIRDFRTDGKNFEIFRQIIEKTAETFGAKAEIEYEFSCIPVINCSDELNKIAHDAAVKLFGEEGIGVQPTLMVSEDFSRYSELSGIPYFFGFLGGREPGYTGTVSNHHGAFNPPEYALWRGAAMMEQFAADYLAQNA